MGVLRLVLLTVGAWAVHVVFVQAYIGLFSSTKQLGFRVMHVIEIMLTMTAMVVIYSMLGPRLPAAAIVATILLTLIAIDAIFFFLSGPELRKKFDAWHFLAAYTAICLVAILTDKALRP